MLQKRITRTDLLRHVLVVIAVAGLVGCTSCGDTGQRPSGGGVPVYTFLGPSSTTNPDAARLYIKLDRNAPGGDINIDGPVRITYSNGATDVVFVPSGSWDCVCRERTEATAQSAVSLDPTNTSTTIGPAKQIMRVASPNPGNAPDCLLNSQK